MAGVGKIRGLNEVLRNLNKEIEKIQKGTKAGLTEACLIVKADSVRNTPIDVGNLRSSAFITVTDGKPDNPSPTFKDDDQGMASRHANVVKQMASITDGPPEKYSGVIAYSAFYALWVHEMPEHYNFNSGSNKFLQRSLLKNKKRILASIKKHSRIK